MSTQGQAIGKYGLFSRSNLAVGRVLKDARKCMLGVCFYSNLRGTKYMDKVLFGGTDNYTCVKYSLCV